MKKTLVGMTAAAVMMMAGAAQADPGVSDGGALSVTGTVVSSISLTIESAGGTTGSMGTGAGTSVLGSIAKFNAAAPTGFTLSSGPSDWTLSSTIGVKVLKANLASNDYTLSAQLEEAPASGIVWKLNGSTLSNSAATILTAFGTYASTASYSWDIVVADSAAAAAIDNVINFTATAN